MACSMIHTVDVVLAIVGRLKDGGARKYRTTIGGWKLVTKYAQKTCPSDLRIATFRESEFPPIMNCVVNAETLHMHFQQFLDIFV